MQEYSIIPVSLKQGKNNKIMKVPNSKLLKQATGQTSWSIFQDRLPTPKEKEIFFQSSHIAIVTGEISGITVIDLDGTAEQDLLEMGFKLPTTPTVRTQSGGKHLYFKYDERLQTTAKINKQKNIDIRNNGGYVVAFGEGYEWINHINNTELLEVPEIFIEMANKSVFVNDNRKVSESISDAYTQARNVNMVSFLRHHGYDVQEKHAFSCIFHDHEDNNPSAQIITNSKGEQRYICHSHNTGKLNLSLIDLWTELHRIDISKAIEQVLAFEGIKYEESEFIKKQKDKYHFNTVRVSDLSYIKENFTYLYKYLNRYEVELRALMDYAESNLHGTKYSHKGQAIFYMPKRYAGNMFTRYKHTATVNTDKAQRVMKLFCLLGIMNRIPNEEVTENARKAAKNLSHITNSGQIREVNFYSFNQLTDFVLSVAEERAKTMQENNFKIVTMTKDVVCSIFGEKIANKVFPDNRTPSNNYKKYLTVYSNIILQEIENKSFTTKQEVINKLDIPITQRKKEYHFDKVINEICSMYDLKFDFANKEIKEQLNINGRGRKRLIYKGLFTDKSI